MPMLAGTVDAKLDMHWNLACLKLGCKGRDLGIRGRVVYQTGQTDYYLGPNFSDSSTPCYNP